MTTSGDIAGRIVVRFKQSRRAIPFDVSKVKKEISQLAEEALDTAVMMTPEGQPIGKMNTLAKTTFKLRHVKGHDRVFLVVIESRPASNNRPTAGGVFEVGRNTIRLYLNAKWPPEALMEQKWAIVDRMVNMGIHEVTHALDVIDESTDYARAEDDPEVYFNQGPEVRAHARQIVDEALLAIRKLKMRARRTKKSLPEGHRLIERLLTDSKTWREMGHFLNRKNERLIRQIVVRELQDAGHI